MPATDLTTINRHLITDLPALRRFAAAAILGLAADPIIGGDTETSSEEYPDTLLAGMSIYSRPLAECVYIPLRHPDLAFPEIEVVDILQPLFEQAIVAFHSVAADIPLLNRMGLRVSEVRDTHMLSNTLQATNGGLKDQVLEYGLADYKQVQTYAQVVAEAKGLTLAQLEKADKNDATLWGFHTIEITKSERATNYACNDAIWARDLLDTLASEHDNLVGDPERAAQIRAWTDDATLLLAESASQGYLVNGGLLEESIRQRAGFVKQEEQELLSILAKDMGWDFTPPASLF